MPFVLRRKADQHYASGRSRHRAGWVADLDDARVYPTRGNATTSLRELFNNKGRWSRAAAQPEDGFEIVPVRIVADDGP